MISFRPATTEEWQEQCRPPCPPSVSSIKLKPTQDESVCLLKPTQVAISALDGGTRHGVPDTWASANGQQQRAELGHIANITGDDCVVRPHHQVKGRDARSIQGMLRL